MARFVRLLRIIQRQVRVRTGALKDWLGHPSMLYFAVPTHRMIDLPAAQKIREPSDVRERRVAMFFVYRCGPPPRNPCRYGNRRRYPFSACRGARESGPMHSEPPPALDSDCRLGCH